MRAVARVADVSRNTVDELFQEAGAACLEYQDRVLLVLPCRRIQCDEAWRFIYAKQKNVPDETNAPEWAGDVWTWSQGDFATELGVLRRLPARIHARRFRFLKYSTLATLSRRA